MKKKSGEPVSIHIQSLINIIQENNWIITTKKGKGKLPLFSGTVEWVIPVYVKKRTIFYILSPIQKTPTINIITINLSPTHQIPFRKAKGITIHMSYAISISSIVLMTGLIILSINVIVLYILNRNPRQDELY